MLFIHLEYNCTMKCIFDSENQIDESFISLIITLISVFFLGNTIVIFKNIVLFTVQDLILALYAHIMIPSTIPSQ